MTDKRRRRPSQPRSQATVDVIADAASELLSSDGYDSFSTNKIAQKAGVGVGSVYEYFRDKDDIVDFLLQRFANDLRSGAIAAFESACAFDISQVLAMVTHSVIEVYKRNPSLHRQLLSRTSHLKAANPLNNTETAIATRMTLLLEEHADKLTLSDLKRCAAVAVRNGRHMVEDSSLDQTFALDLSNVEPELSAMMEGYLLR